MGVSEKNRRCKQNAFQVINLGAAFLKNSSNPVILVQRATSHQQPAAHTSEVGPACHVIINKKKNINESGKIRNKNGSRA